MHRPKEAQDSATPAAQSIAVQVLLRLYPFTGDEAFRRAAEQVLQAYQPLMAEHPWGSASLIAALDIQLGAVEISIAAPPGDRTARQWLAAIHRRYLPRRILTLVPDNPAAPDLAPDGKVPLREGCTAREGRATAYVCRDLDTRRGDRAHRLNLGAPEPAPPWARLIGNADDEGARRWTGQALGSSL